MVCIFFVINFKNVKKKNYKNFYLETGTEFECDGHSLSYADGICVNKRFVERRLKAKNVLYQFDENFSQDNKKIKRCDSGSQAQDTKCQCSQVVGKELQLGNNLLLNFLHNF